jgi:hypothetical protein
MHTKRYKQFLESAVYQAPQPEVTAANIGEIDFLLHEPCGTYRTLIRLKSETETIVIESLSVSGLYLDVKRQIRQHWPVEQWRWDASVIAD